MTKAPCDQSNAEKLVYAFITSRLDNSIQLHVTYIAEKPQQQSLQGA